MIKKINIINCIISQIHKLAYPNGWNSGKNKSLGVFRHCTITTPINFYQLLFRKPFKHIPNPIYSPDVAPLEFGVFDTIKDKLPYEVIDSEDSLKEIIESILSELGIEFFSKIF